MCFPVCDVGDLVTVLTPDSFSSDISWFNPLVEHFIFSVCACKHAHIIFSSDLQDTMDHELIIGYKDNTVSALWDVRSGNSELVAQANTAGILDCYRDRDFWITWAEGIVRFGRGQLFEHMVLEHTVPNYNAFTSVSLSSSDGATGEFNYDIKQGKASFLTHFNVYLYM